MKKNVLFILLTAITVSILSAQRSQRIGYIDMDYILENVDEYQEAKKQLDKKVSSWESEISNMQNVVTKMTTDLKNERPLLTPELIEEREESILEKQTELIEYQQKRFGPQGDYILQKKQLAYPVQDQVFTAVNEIAKQRNYDIIFDKADVIMLYSKDRHDLSDRVLKSIGRSAKRKQAKTRAEKREIEAEEVEANKEVNPEKEARKQALADKKAAKKAEAEARRAKRDSARVAKKKAYDARRKALMEERQRRKDSIKAARAAKKNGSNANPPGEGGGL